MTVKTKRKPTGRAGLVLLAVVFLAVSAPAEEKKESPLVTATRSLKLSGYAQILVVDWDKGVDTFSLRRARASLTGELIKHLRFKLMVDVVKSPALLEAFVEFEPSKIVGLRFGQFKVPFSLESVASDSDIDMINRSAVVETLVPGRDNGSSGRDIGAVLYGSVSVVDYTFGLFNGAGINKADTNSHKDWGGRVVVHPVKFISVGGSLYRGMQSPSADVPLVRRNREGLEADFILKRLSLKSEYIHAEDGPVAKAGWYVQAGFFALPGKLQTLVRYDSLDIDRAIAGDAKNVITVGLNWFILGRTKLQVNYEIHRLETGGRENSGLMAQFQAAF
jgi:phosphate-selective porin OprO/OprP